MEMRSMYLEFGHHHKHTQIHDQANKQPYTFDIFKTRVLCTIPAPHDVLLLCTVQLKSSVAQYRLAGLRVQWIKFSVLLPCYVNPQLQLV